MVKHTQTIRRLLLTNCLDGFDHFVGLPFKGLKLYMLLERCIEDSVNDLSLCKTCTLPLKISSGKIHQIHRKLWIWSHLLRKSLMENYIFLHRTMAIFLQKLLTAFSCFCKIVSQ